MLFKPVRIGVAYFFVLAGVALVPLLIGFGFEAPFSLRDSRDSARAVRGAEAQVAAARVELFLERPTLLLTELSGLYFNSWSADLVQLEAERVLKLSPEIIKVRLINSTNQISFSVDRTNAGPIKQSLSVVEINLIEKVRKNKVISFGDSIFNAGKGYSVLAAIPAQAGNRIFLATIDLSQLSKLVANMNFSRRGVVLITNAAHEVIGHADKNKILKSTKIALPTCLSGQVDATGVVSSGDDKSFSFEAVKLASTNWCVVALEPSADADQWLGRTLMRVSLVFLLALSAAAALAMFLSKRMSKPLSDLVLAVKRVSANEGLDEAHLSPFIEINELGSKFAEMSQIVGRSKIELIDAVTDRTKELALANEELALINARKTEFLNFMSHELRTPLNAVMGFSQLLEAQYDAVGKLTSKQLEYVTDIRLAGDYLLRLVSGLLDLSKIEAGRTEIVMESVSIEAFLQETKRFIDEVLIEKNLNLKIQVTPTDLVWRFDSLRIQQCVLNLLSNAAKFSPYGGEILVVATKSINNFSLAVVDLGPGIADLDNEQLFTQFYQGKHRPEGAIKGTGLGLALTKGLVALHGGTISARNGVQGAVFEFVLPAVDAT
jgi:signal transduction histidine kinase